MKYTELLESEFLTGKDKITEYMKETFEEVNPSQISIESDGLVYYNGSLGLRENVFKLKIRFKEVTGYFMCRDSSIMDLERCPKIIGGSFSCYGTSITSLKFCPQSVGNKFYCQNTKIEDPKEYRYALYCDIGSQFYFYSDIKEIDEIINTYGGSNNRKYWSHAINLLSKVKL